MRSAAWRTMAGMVLMAAGCGDRPKVGTGSAGGPPPEKQDTIAARPDSNPSAALDTIPPRDTTPVVHLVNTGPHGMAAAVRWLVAPDQRAMIVVEDPVGIEAEPVPDAFLYASELTGAVVQVEGVWDVAPSLDWSRLAWGRAFVFRSGEEDSIPEREWQRFLGWLPEDVAGRTTAAMKRRAGAHVFPVSGMSYAKAIGLTQVLDVSGLPAGRAPFVKAPTARLEGWRVRWTPSGDSLAVGAAPATVQDDADATRWTFVRTRPVRSYHDSIRTAAPGRRFAGVAWVVGPTVDGSLPFDMDRVRHIPALAATVTSARGRIRVERRGATSDVGPGAALATTRDGRFIAALRTRRTVREGDHPVELVVYELAP